MSISIPSNSIEAEYKEVIFKLRRGYLTPDTYKSKIMNTKYVPLEVNKWYIMDIGGWNGDLTASTSPNWTQDVEDMDLNIIYTLPFEKTEPVSYDERPNRINVYYADIEWPFSYSDLPRHPRLIFHKGYGTQMVDYIPINLNENSKFINWINENPFEVKQ